MSPSGWTRLTEAQVARRRLATICRHVIRRPFLILALAGLAFLITNFGKDIPMLYGLSPLGAVLIMGSMGRYRSAAERADEPSSQDAETN
ncbi:hypothetical protein [Streptomyces solaniscabiei]|uniref:hypothetical protein n=1 Tax=Streptomyces solaniscabiei TaxID=2683255 RepID=UPI001CE2D8C0|nr:hypothetical protein [Streptomyces solaniscabiei]